MENKMDSPPITLSDYLDQIDDSSKKNEIKDWFGTLTPNFQKAIDEIPISGANIPEVRILDTEEVEALGMSYCIYISKGLLDRLYTSDSEIFSCVSEEISQQLCSWRWGGAYLSFIWIMMHEFAHGARRHQDKSDEIANDEVHGGTAISHATEFDADLIAAAHIFRLIQNDPYLKQVNPDRANLAIDIITREVAFCAIFNALRSLLPSVSASASHPSGAQRFTDIAAKLTIMQYRREDSFSRDIDTPESEFRGQKIAQCFVRCEEHFLRKHGDRYGTLIPDLKNPPENRPHIMAWEKMDRDALKEYERRNSASKKY